MESSSRVPWGLVGVAQHNIRALILYWHHCLFLSRVQILRRPHGLSMYRLFITFLNIEKVTVQYDSHPIPNATCACSPRVYHLYIPRTEQCIIWILLIIIAFVVQSTGRLDKPRAQRELAAISESPCNIWFCPGNRASVPLHRPANLRWCERGVNVLRRMYVRLRMWSHHDGILLAARLQRIPYLEVPMQVVPIRNDEMREKEMLLPLYCSYFNLVFKKYY